MQTSAYSMWPIDGGRFAGRSVFVTGHTGFKGSWLSIWLHQLGANVAGYSLGLPSNPCNFQASQVRGLLTRHYEADIRDVAALRKALDEADPEVIFHLAAQPLVRESYQTPYETMEANFMGTCNLLEAVRQRSAPCVVLVITSDKCYEIDERDYGYCENDPLGGHDPYSASKGAVELLASSYRRSFFSPENIDRHGVKLATVRAGNVIGGGDWAQDRIVPDIVAHLTSNRVVPLRNPGAVRPWQHVLEPLGGYLRLAGEMLASDDGSLCEGWNFGPDARSSATVQELVAEFCRAWGGGGWADVSSGSQPHEAHLLRLSIDKAVTRLGWRPAWTFRKTIEYTARWYREFRAAGDDSMQEACLRDIAEYCQAVAEQGVARRSYRQDAIARAA